MERCQSACPQYCKYVGSRDLEGDRSFHPSGAWRVASWIGGSCLSFCYHRKQRGLGSKASCRASSSSGYIFIIWIGVRTWQVGVLCCVHCKLLSSNWLFLFELPSCSAMLVGSACCFPWFCERTNNCAIFIQIHRSSLILELRLKSRQSFLHNMAAIQHVKDSSVIAFLPIVQACVTWGVLPKANWKKKLRPVAAKGILCFKQLWSGSLCV